MLEKVQMGERRFEDYRGIISDTLFDEVVRLGKKLRGKRILQINATSKGGGVVELLRPSIPLLNDLGLQAEWQTLEAPQSFFGVTKHMHNGLQGDLLNLKPSQWDTYENYNRQLAEQIDPSKWDVIVVHDPQPAAVRSFMGVDGEAKWAWRCHIDSKHANPSYLRHFVKYWDAYDGAIFTMAKFVPPGYKPKHLGVIPVAIDPLNPKNVAMKTGEAKTIVESFGIDVTRPLVTQVSRFDPWKDPLGVIEAWKEARAEVPGLQLALIGDTAKDDPEGSVILKAVETVTVGEPDVYIIANRADDRAVQAFQSHSNLIIQKSLREGFGLTVSEALWNGTPVVGGAVGGIPLQVIDGKSGFLVTSVKQAATRMVALLADAKRAKAMGQYGHELVRHKFLLPRMIRDDMQFWLELLAED
ncbi:MAG TPA: glycosyltransferase [Candidatus Nanoarchaeia archaeon]|nr:glycosyltransferase [Candidatus Nanoarchaeia archaeon]